MVDPSSLAPSVAGAGHRPAGVAPAGVGGRPGRRGGGVDLDAELGELFSAQSAVEERSPELGSTDLGDAGLADIFKEFKKGVDKQLGQGRLRHALQPRHRVQGDGARRRGDRRVPACGQGRQPSPGVQQHAWDLLHGQGHAEARRQMVREGPEGSRNDSEEEYLGLRYDLAMAHEAAGDGDGPSSIFTELYGQDAELPRRGRQGPRAPGARRLARPTLARAPVGDPPLGPELAPGRHASSCSGSMDDALGRELPAPAQPARCEPGAQRPHPRRRHRARAREHRPGAP